MLNLRIRVLIVDDMRTMRKVISHEFNKLGYVDLLQAQDGVVAFRQLVMSEIPIGLIVSDWNMPEMNGQQLLEKVRGDAQFKDTPFLMITAEKESDIERNAKEAGVTAFMHKPLEAGRIKILLESIPVLNR